MRDPFEPGPVLRLGAAPAKPREDVAAPKYSFATFDEVAPVDQAAWDGLVEQHAKLVAKAYALAPRSLVGDGAVRYERPAPILPTLREVYAEGLSEAEFARRYPRPVE